MVLSARVVLILYHTVSIMIILSLFTCRGIADGKARHRVDFLLPVNEKVTDAVMTNPCCHSLVSFPTTNLPSLSPASYENPNQDDDFVFPALLC